MPWLFIVVTAAIWLVVKLSKPGYEQAIEIKLKIQDAPLAAYLPEDTSIQFSVTLKGRGFDLMAAKRRLKNLEKLPLKDLLGEKNDQKWRVGQEELKDYFQDNLSRTVTVLEVHPSSLVIRAKQTTQKQVPISARVLLKTEPGYRVTKHTLSPEFATLQGDAEILENWDTVWTAPYEASQLQDSLNVALSLHNPHPAKVSITPQQVRLTAQIELWTEVHLRVPITAEMPYGNNLSPTEISLTINVPARLQSHVSADDFLFTLAEKNGNSTDVFRLVTLKQKPLWAEVLDWQPKRVAVIETKQP